MQNDRNKSKEGQNSNEDETATGSDPITLNTAPVYADELYESPDEIESHTPEQSQMLNPKRAKSFDVKLMRSAKSRFTSGGEQTGIPVKRQHSEPAANKFDVLRRSLYQRTNSVKSSIKKTTAEFFGLDSESKNESKAAWLEKRKRLLNRTLGPLKSETLHDEGIDTQDGFIHDLNLTGESFYDDVPHKKPVLKLAFSGIHSVASTLKKNRSDAEQDISLKSIKLRPSFNDLPPEKFIGGELSQENVAQNKFLEAFAMPSSFEQVDSNTFIPDFIEDDAFGIPTRGLARTGTVADQSDRRAGQSWQFLGEPHRIPISILSNIRDNSDRRQYGMGIVGKLLNRKFRKNLTPEEKRQLHSHPNDYRPYFTYWVTIVQIVILFISLCTYGFGPVGFTKVKISAPIFVTSLSIQQVDYFESNNIWLGPRASDLIHLGAKYTPCMRKDKLVFREIDKERNEERNTACCARNYDNGCVQTTKDRCSPLLSTWLKWDPNNTDSKNTMIIPSSYFYNQAGQTSVILRSSGTVCGQDPRYCQDPVSVFPNEWPDDISRWPLCRNSIQAKGSSERHMTCDLVGRPCCIGIHGECKIVTRQYCDFVKGFFHEEATLCSQVSCMSDVCGMLQIKRDDNLFQFYRVWTSMFLHAGIIHIGITILFQFYIMRDIEKLIGPFRIGLIYMLSGIGGNLASAVFVPYRAEVGPGGCQFGLLACLIVEVLHNWNLLESPWRALSKLLLIAVGLFTYGLLPWIDNYAHLFGFCIGFCLSLSLLPFITIVGSFRIRVKICLIASCFLAVITILVVLCLFLYKFPIYDCKYCSYFNCIPLTEDWCDDHDMLIKRKDIL